MNEKCKIDPYDGTEDIGENRMETHLLLQENPNFSENPMFVLKPMEEKDKPDYMQLLSENSAIKNSRMRETVWEEMWQNRISENLITYSILSPETLEFMGYCQYKNLSTPKPDIGIDILPRFQHQGLGYAVCCVLISTFFERTSSSEIYYKVERRNTPSIALVEKLGGTYSGINHIYGQLLSLLNSLSAEEIAERGGNVPALIASLEKHKDELSEKEYPADILIYRIDRNGWINKRRGL